MGTGIHREKKKSEIEAFMSASPVQIASSFRVTTFTNGKIGDT